MLAVCDRDYERDAKFLGSRNKAVVLVLLDAGVRLSELIGMTLEDINASNGNMRVMGKGSKEKSREDRESSPESRLALSDAPSRQWRG